MNETLNKEIIEISVEDIIPNRFQPRLTFDVEALNELANSIREHGIIQPLVVRKLQDKYEIIAGERRYRAASSIGMKKVPCIVMNLNDNESAEVAVIENIQRKEMTPLEEAKSYKKILDMGYLTQDELAKKMGKSQSNIANKLRLLNLDDIVQEAILNGKISERHARSLLKIESKQEQRNILNEIIEKRLTVRQTDDLIKERFNVGVEKDNMDNNMNNHFNMNEKNNNENNIFKTLVVQEPVVNNNMNYQNPYMSTPQVIIPQEPINSNPQADLINSIGMPNDNQTTPNIDMNQLNQTSDIFKSGNPNVQQNNNLLEKTDIQSVINPSVLSTPQDAVQNVISPSVLSTPQDTIQNVISPSVLSTPQDTIQNVINPSVLSTPQDTIQNVTNPSVLNTQKQVTQNTIPFNNGMNVDINAIKNSAQDIIQKEEKPANVPNLMSSDSSRPENKFFVDLDIPDDMSMKSEPLPFKVQSAVDAINRRIEEIKLQGTFVRKEEKDLGNAYEIVIRIDK